MGSPSQLELERFCFLDDMDQELVERHRGDQNRLGFSLQLVTVRALGTFLTDPLDVPSAVVVPYFWSDQYDVKIQCLGEPEATDIVHLVEDDGRKFLAYYERDGVVVGVVGGGMPGKVMKVRGKIAAATPIAELLG